MMTAQEALARLKRGNEKFLAGEGPRGADAKLRERLVREGQRPFACVVTCSDSRVCPEEIFCAGLGELFVIRTAGNTISASELATVAYAGHHLHVPLAVVMGHTHCGAVEAAIAGAAEENIRHIVEGVKRAIGDERDPRAAELKNARYQAARIAATGEFAAQGPGPLVFSALYETESGRVLFDEQ